MYICTIGGWGERRVNTNYQMELSIQIYPKRLPSLVYLGVCSYFSGCLRVIDSINDYAKTLSGGEHDSIIGFPK